VAPYGARFLWPLSAAYLHAPVPVFGEIVVDRTGSMAFVASLWAPGTRQAWGREVASALLFLAAGGVAGLRRGRRPSVALPS
jgi:hypothetical protein